MNEQELDELTWKFLSSLSKVSEEQNKIESGMERAFFFHSEIKKCLKEIYDKGIKKGEQLTLQKMN